MQRASCRRLWLFASAFCSVVVRLLLLLLLCRVVGIATRPFVLHLSPPKYRSLCSIQCSVYGTNSINNGNHINCFIYYYYLFDLCWNMERITCNVLQRSDLLVLVCHRWGVSSSKYNFFENVQTVRWFSSSSSFSFFIYCRCSGVILPKPLLFAYLKIMGKERKKIEKLIPDFPWINKLISGIKTVRMLTSISWSFENWLRRWHWFGAAFNTDASDFEPKVTKKETIKNSTRSSYDKDDNSANNIDDQSFHRMPMSACHIQWHAHVFLVSASIASLLAFVSPNCT